MSRLLFRLECPSYGICWLSLDCEDGSRSELVLVAGGGGTGNTGVKNQVQVAKYTGKGEFDFLPSFATDRFCTGVSQGRLHGTVVVCALLEMKCVLLSVSQANANSEVCFKPLLEFTADFAENEAQANSCVITSSNNIVTGGEDGIVRIWNVSRGDETFSVPPNAQECKGHTAPVMAIAKHPTGPWVCSASKDGTSKVWNLKTAEMIANIPAIDVAGGPSQNNSLLSFQCRGCVFSADGKQLYTILCGRKGATHLVKFSLKFDDQNRIIDAVPNKTVIANKDPSTCLVMSDNGEFLAVGCSNGFVTVLRTDALSKVISRACHDDYPVTGVVFASSAVTKAENSNCYFLTCSVDNRMATVILRKRLTLLLIFAFMLLLLGYLFWLLYNKR